MKKNKNRENSEKKKILPAITPPFDEKMSQCERDELRRQGYTDEAGLDNPWEDEAPPAPEERKVS